MRRTVRLSSVNGNFLISNGSIGTFGGGTGASYVLNKCVILAVKIDE